MNARTISASVLAITLGAASVPSVAHGQMRLSDPGRWGIGLGIAPIGTPTGHVGIPTGGDMSAPHLAFDLTLRFQLNPYSALNAGIGLPHAALGLGGWFGYEVFARVAADRRAIVALELYEDSALQLGAAGPDYFARHGNAYVGYAYAVSGPVAFALRFPVGVRLRWLGGLFDTYAEAVSIVTLTPSIDPLFELVTGVRLRF